MKNKNCFGVSFVLVILLSLALVSASRLPTVQGDEDTWGAILNEYLSRIGGANATQLNLTMVNGSNIYAGAINSTHVVDNTFLLTTGDTAIGNYTFDNGTLFIDSSSDRVGIGTATPSQKLEVNGSLNVTGEINEMTISGEGDNTLLGNYDNSPPTVGTGNILVGYSAGDQLNSGGNSNVLIGNSAGYYTGGGDWNTMIGYEAGLNNDEGSGNIYIGLDSGYSCYDSGCSNNTAIGTYAGYSNLEGGNVFIGYRAGYNEVGPNKLYIDNSDTSSPLIYGDFGNNYLTVNGNVGIGTLASSYKFEVNSSTTDTIAKFFSSDDTAQIIISDDNTNTRVGAKDFKGFFGLYNGLDSRNLVIDSTGKVGIGITSPTQKLDVNGSVNIAGNITSVDCIHFESGGMICDLA